MAELLGKGGRRDVEIVDAGDVDGEAARCQMAREKYAPASRHAHADSTEKDKASAQGEKGHLGSQALRPSWAELVQLCR